MLGTGKYDFPGIRKAGAVALKAVLAGTSWGAYLVASPFKPAIDFLTSWSVEWLANHGLIVLNLGAIYVNGKLDQARFDKAMADGIEKAKIPGLTDAQKKVMDDEVLKAFRRFARIGNP